MTTQGVRRESGLQERPLLNFNPRYRPGMIQRFLVHSLMALLLGGLIGLYVLVTTQLPFKSMVLLILMVVGLCGIVIMGTLLGSMQRLFLAIIMVEFPLQIDLNIGRNELMAHLDAISGFSISMLTLSLIVLYALWLADILSKRLPPPQLKTLVQTSLPILVYLGIGLITFFWAELPMYTLYEMNLLVQGFLLYIYIVHTVKTRQELMLMVGFLMVGLVLEIFCFLGVVVIGDSLDLVILSFTRMVDGRIAGTLGSPNVAGSYFSLMIPFAFSLLVTPIGPWAKRLVVAVLFLAVGAILMTGSRGSWIAVAFALSTFYLFCWWRKWLSLATPIFVGLAAIPLLIVFREVLLARIFGDDNNSADSRWPLYRLAFYMIQDHWLLGVGMNNFVANLPHYLTAEFTGNWIRTVHNRYLLVWAETGLVGLLAYLWFMADTLRKGWQVWMLKDRWLSPIALSLSMALIGWMIHMSVAIFHSRLNLISFFLIAGLITAMQRIGQRTAVRAAAPLTIAATTGEPRIHEGALSRV